MPGTRSPLFCLLLLGGLAVFHPLVLEFFGRLRLAFADEVPYGYLLGYTAVSTVGVALMRPGRNRLARVACYACMALLILAVLELIRPRLIR